MAMPPMNIFLEKYGDRVPVRENEWDNRHFWRVSNAEHLELTENCGIINLSHFAMYDIEGPDHVALMEWLCAARIAAMPISARASTPTSSMTKAWCVPISRPSAWLTAFA
ncbi:FAD dependent oxidoreductase [Brucella melitensis]|nr:FAD dependent oxidoreductase [Brucella melitensis]